MREILSEPLLPWLLAALFLVILMRRIFRKPRNRVATADLWNSEVVQSLRAQLVRQQDLVKDQTEFFINFPEVVKILTGALTVEQVTSAMSRGLTTLLGCKKVGIFLARADNMLRLSDGAGFLREFRGTFVFPLKTKELLPILKLRSVSSMRDHPEAVRFLKPLTLEPCLAAPVWYGERLLGLLVISAPTAEQKAAYRIFAMLADLMSVNLHAASTQAEARKAAERDELTGLLNRAAVMNRVRTEVERCGAYSSKFSLLLVDVDHLHRYNERNGTSAGDDALKKTAALMQGSLRKTDLAARFEGGKFALLLQNSNRDEAKRTSERMRSAVAQGEFPFGEFQPAGNVSVSVGAAVFPDDAHNSESLFQAAEDALHRAKKAGRNRVEVCDGSISID